MKNAILNLILAISIVLISTFLFAACAMPHESRTACIGALCSPNGTDYYFNADKESDAEMRGYCVKHGKETLCFEDTDQATHYCQENDWSECFIEIL